MVFPSWWGIQGSLGSGGQYLGTLHQQSTPRILPVDWKVWYLERPGHTREWHTEVYHHVFIIKHWWHRDYLQGSWCRWLAANTPASCEYISAKSQYLSNLLSIYSLLYRFVPRTVYVCLYNSKFVNQDFSEFASLLNSKKIVSLIVNRTVSWQCVLQRCICNMNSCLNCLKTMTLLRSSLFQWRTTGWCNRADKLR